MCSGWLFCFKNEGRTQASEGGRQGGGKGREGKGRTEGQGLEQRAAAMAHGLGL